MNSTSQIQNVSTTKTVRGGQLPARGPNLPEHANPKTPNGKEWWTRLPWGERALIRAVFRLLGRAKRSQAPDSSSSIGAWGSAGAETDATH